MRKVFSTALLQCQGEKSMLQIVLFSVAQPEPRNPPNGPELPGDASLHPPAVILDSVLLPCY